MNLPRTHSAPALYMPIRRRSLLQHGVATRRSLFSDNDSRQSLPSQMHANEFNDYYCNPAKSTSSPLSSIAALGRQNGAPGPRVETPPNLEYGHTGVFKLGSLRITNGAASPSPSNSRPGTGVDEDYLTMGARKYTEGPLRPDLNQRSNTYTAPSEVSRPWVARSQSPLKQTYEFEPEQSPLKIDTQLPLPDPSFALFHFKDSPTKSLDLAREYMQDMALSPFSFEDSAPPSPRLEATSKHMAVDDDLFAPEPGSPNPETLEHAPRSFDSGYGTGDTRVVSGPKELAPKALAKADSGYSSNISLRSFKKDAAPGVPAKDTPPTPPKDAVSRTSSSVYSRVSSSTYSVTSQTSDTTLRAQRSFPSLPKQDYFPPPPAREAPPVPPKHTAAYELDMRTSQQNWQTQTRPSADIHQYHTRRQQSLPAIPKAIREPPVLKEKVSNSGDSMSSNGSKWRSSKVQKQRPQSAAPVYTVQAVRNSAAFSVPPVPAVASRKLEERVDGFPVVCFPNTTSGLKKSSSKETLGTIFSVGSAEVRDELNFARLQSALPPVPVHASIPEYAPTPPEQKPEFNRRNTYQPSSSAPTTPGKPFDGRRSMQPMARERSPVPRMSIEQQQEAFEAHVTSYSTISSSLGSSPYDVAIHADRPKSSGARAKSLTSQFETDAAARFHRARDVSGTSTVLQSKESYESIAAGNPYILALQTLGHSRKSSRDYPPQAHSNASVKRPFAFVPPPPQPQFLPPQPQYLAEEKARRSPPVSMKTRKSLPAPARTAPVPPQMPPQPQPHDSWAKPADFWAERRKSAGEALLQTKTSMEFSRPGSARPSIEYQRPAPALRTYNSFDQAQRQGWEADHAAMQSGYDHSYGAAYTQSQSYQADDYYAQPEEDDAQTQRRVHARTTSTEQMLVLDRYTGGLDYGFDGQGISASAGTRNSGSLLGGSGTGRKGESVAREWGVDLSDVPVFLQRVRMDH